MPTIVTLGWKVKDLTQEERDKVVYDMTEGEYAYWDSPEPPSDRDVYLHIIEAGFGGDYTGLFEVYSEEMLQTDEPMSEEFDLDKLVYMQCNNPDCPQEGKHSHVPKEDR